METSTKIACNAEGPNTILYSEVPIEIIVNSCPKAVEIETVRTLSLFSVFIITFQTVIKYLLL
jgi:hypothetical protein